MAPLLCSDCLCFGRALHLGVWTFVLGLALPLSALNNTISFSTYLYLSSTTFFTLGLGDVSPLPAQAVPASQRGGPGIHLSGSGDQLRASPLSGVLAA
jgi:hypothetical protein